MYKEQQKQTQFIVPLDQSYNKQSITQRTHNIILPPDIRQSLGTFFNVFPAYDNSFVCMSKQSVKHVSEKGEILNQLTIQNIFQAVALSPKIVLIASMQKTRKHTIFTLTQWNMQINSTISITHKIKCQIDNTISQLFLFPESRLVCIVQNWNQGSYIAYYRYPLSCEKDQPVHTELINANLPDMPITVNIDNRSGIRWFEREYRNAQFIDIYTYQLQLNQKTTTKQEFMKLNSVSRLKLHKFPTKSLGNYKNYFVRFTDFWQIRSKTFFICIQACLKQKNNQKQQKKYLPFIWEHTTNKINAISLGISNDTFWQTQFIGQYRKFKKQERNCLVIYKGKFKSSPVVYVDASRQKFKIICIEKPKVFSCLNYQFIIYHFNPCYDVRSFYKIYEYKTTALITLQQEDPEMFDEWSDKEQEEYAKIVQEEEKYIQKSIKNEKILPKNISKKDLGALTKRQNYNTIFQIKHKRIKYFEHSHWQYIAWILTNLIQNCDEDLIYYVGLLVEQ